MDMEKQKVYKFTENYFINMHPGDLKRSPDDCFFIYSNFVNTFVNLLLIDFLLINKNTFDGAIMHL